MNYTSEQLDAINTRQTNILVSAAAGSGKTGVLTQRIVSHLQEGTNIDELLVLTYTRAAAGEMKERVRKMIREAAEAAPAEQREFWHRQQNLIGDAPITTIHSFCQRLLKRHYNLIPGLDPNFRIADGNRNALLKSDILTAYFEECCAEPDTEQRNRYFELFRHYGSRLNEEGLKKQILALSEFAASQGNPTIWLEKALKRFGDLDGWYEAAVTYGKDGLRLLLAETRNDLAFLEQQNGPEACIATLNMDIESLSGLLNDFQWAILGDAKPFGTKKRKGKYDDPVLDEFTVSRRNIRKEYFADNLQPLFYRDFHDYAAEIGMLQPLMETLVAMTSEFNRRYAEAKIKQAAIDFSDLELYALQLLTEHPELAAEYRRNFKEVLIDEYQDVNGLQEQIITLLAGDDKLFTVGDVKQSIYGFRLANHELFRDRAKAYSRDDAGQTIYLNRNFRSRKEVLAVTNAVFERLLNPAVSDITYADTERLIYGSETYREKDVPVELAIVDCTANPEGETAVILQARYIANRIKEMMAEGMTIVRNKVEQPLNYGDITVLLRSVKNTGETIAEELQNCGIPAVAPQNTGYLAGRETRLLRCLLAVLDNPLQDIPLAAVMRSPLFDFTEDELLALALNRHRKKLWEVITEAETLHRPEIDVAKTVAFREEMIALRQRAKIYPVGELVDALIKEYDFAAFWGGLPKGCRRRQNLELFREEAYRFQQDGSGGLFDFLRFTEHLAATGGDVPKDTEEITDAVQIISIHHSKGLEFPVVFLADTEKKWNMTDLNDALILDRELGFGPKFYDYERRLALKTLPQLLIYHKKKQNDIAEEMRVLYVAMTRAAEKLIITASDKDTKKATVEGKLATAAALNELNPGYLPGTAILKSTGSYRWLEETLPGRAERDSMLKITVVPPLTEGEILPAPQEKLIYPPGDLERLKQLLAFRAETVLPAKVSVSSLLPGNEADTDTEQVTLPTPRFLSGTDELHPTEIGTAFHTFMEHLDLRRSYTQEELQAFRDTLVSREIFSSPAAASVNLDSVQAFLNSNYGRELKTAMDIRREMAFVGGFAANELFPEAENDTRTVILQGAVDLLYRRENGDWVLLDYKTNRLTAAKREAFLEKYGRQMELYTAALQRIYDIEVKERVFFLTQTGEFIGY